jgi:outer membrane protein OmpA-like peptidoglycan-associated protein
MKRPCEDTIPMRALILPTLAATFFGACAFTGAASFASDTSPGDGRLKLAQFQPKDSKEEEAKKKQEGRRPKEDGRRPQGEGRGQPPAARGQPPQGQPADRGQRVQQPPVQRPLQTAPGGESQPRRVQPGGGFTQQPRQVQKPQEGGAQQKDEQPGARRGRQDGPQRGDNTPPVQRQLEGQPSGRGVPKQVERPPASDPGLLRKSDPRGDPKREAGPRREGDPRRSADPQRPDDTRRFQGKDERPQQPGGRPGIGGGAPRVGDQGRPGDGRALRLEDMQKGRRERVEAGGQRRVIEEPDRRVIVRQGNRAIIRHDESARFRRLSRDARTERRNDGTSVTIVNRRNGQVFSVVDGEGRLVRRYRRTREGREVNLIDNRRHFGGGRRVALGIGLGLAVGLAAPRILIPREKYIVEYDGASADDVYEALSAPPIEELDREYSLEEIRASPHLRDRMRRVDLDVINFEFGSWEVNPDQYSRLEWVANAINRVLERNPDEIFLIEGHTDAVGSDEDNLGLSDRRAEAVATVLSEQFDVPPENLVTQGYGEEFLKVQSEGPERINRRVAARRITPLMQRHLSAR